MPEAVAVFFVLIVTVGIFIYAQLQARNPSNRDAVAELRQLRLQHAWLGEQLERAQQEKWDHVMLAHLAEQHAAASRELAKAAPAVPAAIAKPPASVAS